MGETRPVWRGSYSNTSDKNLSESRFHGLMYSSSRSLKSSSLRGKIHSDVLLTQRIKTRTSCLDTATITRLGTDRDNVPDDSRLS
jgi:hypothetical protein